MEALLILLGVGLVLFIPVCSVLSETYEARQVTHAPGTDFKSVPYRMGTDFKSVPALAPWFPGTDFKSVPIGMICDTLHSAAWRK